LGEGKGAAEVELLGSKRIGKLIDQVPHFLGGEIIKHAEPAAKYSSPIRGLRELIGDPKARRKVSIGGFEGRRATGSESQLGQIFEIESRYSGNLWSTQGCRSHIDVPSQTICKGQSWSSVPRVLREYAEVPK